MTVSTTVNRAQYDGNGATTVFPYPFRILDASHLVVTVIDSAENETTLMQDTDYTISGVGRYNGGYITLTGGALAIGKIISLDRVVPDTQETSIRNQGSYLPEIHEDAFDKLTMIIQGVVSTIFGRALLKPSWLAKYYDAKNNRIANLANPVNAQDAATKSYVDAGDASNNQHADDLFKRTLRVPESSVPVISPVSARKNSLFGFGSFGQMVPIFSWTETADLAIKLASSTGAYLSGYRDRRVGDRLDDEVSVLDFGTANAFGTAMMAAIDFVMSQGGGNIFVPGGNYVLDTSVVKTLTANVSIRMSSGAYVRVDSPMDVFNINAGDYRFVLRDGIFAANWSAGIEHDAAILRIEASTLKRTCIVEHVTGETLSGQYFKYAVYGNTVNDSEFNFIHFNGPYPIWLTATKSGASAHAMTNNISFCKFYGATVGITIVNDASLGCEGTKIHFCDILAQTGVQVIATSALGSSYLPPEFDIIGGHINAYIALSIQAISRFKMIGVDVQSKHRTDDGVLGVCQFYSCQSVDIVSANKFTSVSLSGAPATERKTQVYLGKYNSLVTARVYIGGNDFWLEGMTNPLISMSDPSDVSGLYFDVNKRSTLGPIILRAYKDRIRIYDDVDLTAYDVNEGLAENTSHSFSSSTGILIITKPPHGHNVRVSATTLPAGSTVNQVVVNNMYGEDITIDFEAAELLFTHGANLICPDGVSTKAWLPCRVVFRMINNQQSKIIGISGIAVRHNRTAAPASSAASGVVGDEYFDGTYYYKYFINYGWRRTEFTTW